MKGMIFTSFLYLVEERYGIEMVEEVIAEAAPVSGGIYTTIISLVVVIVCTSISIILIKRRILLLII